jgi:hypothetical protein
MSDPEDLSSSIPQTLATETPRPAPAIVRAPGMATAERHQVTVHRLDGGLEQGASDSRALTVDGFPIFTPPDSDRARWIPVRDIKYVVIGPVEDPELEADLGD